MSTEPPPSLGAFRLRAPLLHRGVCDTQLFETDLLWGHLKVYSDGGENDLHAHPHEDHAFIVVQGEACFYDDADRETRVARYDGMLIPRGAYYRFRSIGAGNLVMLRIGAGSNSHAPGHTDERVGPDGTPMAHNPSQRARDLEAPVESGEWFGTT